MSDPLSDGIALISWLYSMIPSITAFLPQAVFWINVGVAFVIALGIALVVKKAAVKLNGDKKSGMEYFYMVVVLAISFTILYYKIPENMLYQSIIAGGAVYLLIMMLPAIAVELMKKIYF